MKRGDTTETSVDVKDMVDRSGQNGRGEEKIILVYRFDLTVCRPTVCVSVVSASLFTLVYSCVYFSNPAYTFTQLCL